MTQLTDKPTRNENILDLTLTTNTDLISNLDVIPGISDHQAVSFGIETQARRQKKPERHVYQYRKANTEGLLSDMAAFQETFLNSDPLNNTVEENWNTFKSTLTETMNRHIPQKKITSRWNLAWITPGIRRMIRQKKRAWKSGKHNKESKGWKRFLVLEKEVKEAIQKAHRSYIDNILDGAVKDNPKKFYSYIKQKRSGVSSIPVLKTNNSTISESDQKAEALNKQYTSVFTNEPNDTLPTMDGQPTPDMPPVYFTSRGIEKLLQGLNTSKASGPDLIPTRVLKMVAAEVAPILSVIFQQSYDTGQVPTDWLQANVTAVFKKGDKTVPSNYRPVSLTCILCKTMEHILFSQIMRHLDSHNVLVNYQHGFRKNHSCETQLLATMEELSRNLDQRKTTDLLILDFSKAFDTVPHRRLLHKLNHYGVTGRTNRWISS